MIRSRVVVHDNRFLERVDERVQQLAKRAVAAAADAAAPVATRQAQGKSTYRTTRVKGTGDGYEAGIKANNPLARIYDKGSLGKRKGALKRDRRKQSWQVTQKRRAYEAHRNPETLTDSSKGVAPLDILAPARRAGRKAMKAALGSLAR